MKVWKPELDGTEDDPLRTAIYQAIGTASVCWIEKDGKIVFDPQMAQWVADGLLEWIEQRQ